MALVVLLLPATADDVALGPAAMASLSRLGVTSVALVRDEECIGLVLDGWAFDAAAAGEAAAAVALPASPVRTLRPLVQMAVVTTATQGGSE